MKLLIVLLSCVLLAQSAPLDWDLEDPFNTGLSGFGFGFTLPKVNCQSLGCPAETNSCSQKKETSEDKKSINTTIKCLSNDKIVYENTTSDPNPNPDASINEYQYFGSFTSGNHNINIINTTGNDKTNTDSGLETFT